MISYLSSLLLIVSIFLMGCSEPSAIENTNSTSVSQTRVTENLGQYLPITAKAVFPKGVEIKLEVAQTRKEQALGLMYRPELPDNRGMLFSFPAPQRASFWMKNVPVPLDMIFLRNGVVRYIAASSPPCKRTPCPTYGPREPIDQVIELRSGRTQELNLQVGDRIRIKNISDS